MAVAEIPSSKNCSEAGIYKSATGVVYEGQFKTLGIARCASARQVDLMDSMDPMDPGCRLIRNLEIRDIHIYMKVS